MTFNQFKNKTRYLGPCILEKNNLLDTFLRFYKDQERDKKEFFLFSYYCYFPFYEKWSFIPLRTKAYCIELWTILKSQNEVTKTHFLSSSLQTISYTTGLFQLLKLQQQIWQLRSQISWRLNSQEFMLQQKDRQGVGKEIDRQTGKETEAETERDFRWWTELGSQ